MIRVIKVIEFPVEFLLHYIWYRFFFEKSLNRIYCIIKD